MTTTAVTTVRARARAAIGDAFLGWGLGTIHALDPQVGDVLDALDIAGVLAPERHGWVGDQLRPKDPAWAGRSFWHVPDLDTMPDSEGDANVVYDLNNDQRVKLQCDTLEAGAVANVVGSELHHQPHDTPDGMRLHAPVLDIDYPARLVPSSTPGHFHLYLDKPMPWPRYAFLLWALSVAGIIEPGYARAGLRRRGTFARVRPSKPKAGT